MKHIFFFSTAADIQPALKRFEANAPLKFVETGKRAAPNRPVYLESSEIPQPGIATHDAASACMTYMVSHRDTKNVMYAFKNDAGEQRWLLGNGDNEETVLLTLAGLWRTGTLLPGDMCTLHENAVAQELMRWFLSALRQECFAKVEAWWVGREALDMLSKSKRLATVAEQSPPEFDLKWSQVVLGQQIKRLR